ncbi:MAG: hypothetical protein ACKV2Q_06485 [Planctomycetaceae bacterium]
MRITSLVCLMVSTLPNAGWSQAPAPNESQITQARLKGIEFLKSKQLDDGSWEFPAHEVGITALCTLALLENGVPQSDPVIDKGHRFVRKSTKELGSTYDIALAIVILSRLDEYGNKQAIRDLGARLIAGQNVGGGWGYTCPAKITSSILTNPESRPKAPDGVGDNSCTQFAVLGLWTASRTGMDIDQPMSAIARRFRTTQNSDGGWPYTSAVANQGDKAAVPNPSGSAMTFAGLFSLTVARANKLRKQLEERELSGDNKTKPSTSGTPKSTSGSTKKDDKKKVEKPDEKKDTPPEVAEKSDEGSTLLKDPIFAKGLVKAGEFVQGGDQARYFLWTIERLGVLLGQEKIGGVDWFAKGADILIKTQQPDGSWPEVHNDKGLSQTSFAILFLRKANLGSDISRLLEGEPEKAFVFSGRADKPRFATLEEAIKAAQPGETLRIEGDGPFKLPHVLLDKNMTIEAGHGYLPTFVYDVGFDARGVRSRPDKDPDARYLLKTTAASVTLEGLKFEFDPPEIGATVSWTALRVAGGSVRMLNCSITEEGRKGVALIEVTEPSRLHLQNCLLGGGRAAIEIAASGTQELGIENCLLFSDQCVSVVKHASAKDADTKLQFRACSVQGTNVVHAPSITTPIGITAENCLFKTDWIGQALLVADNSKKDRSWSGENNVYSVTKWLGANSKPVASVTDAKSFAKFWGIEDKGSSAKTIVFEGKRSNKSSSHRMRATEFALAAQSELAFSGSKTGMQFLIVGAGRAFSRYRESSLYSDWKKTLAAAQ